MSSTLPEFAPPPAQQLGRNPMLPVHPATAAMDSQYSADEAVLRANMARQYADILQQLGYVDDQGNYIPGSVSTNAARTKTDLNRSSDIAAEGVTNDSQRAGTLFSGYRATQQARQQYPFQQAMLDLGIDTPLKLAQLHEQAAGLTDQYTLQNNQLMAAAAQRAAGGIISSGGGGMTLAPGAGYAPGTDATPAAAPAGTISGTGPATYTPPGPAGVAAGAPAGAAPVVTDTIGHPPPGVLAPLANFTPSGPGVVNDTIGPVPAGAQHGVDQAFHPADVAIAALKAIKPHTMAIPGAAAGAVAAGLKGLRY